MFSINFKKIETTTKHIVIETNNLAIGYKQRNNTTIVAKNINFNIEKGKLVFILGKNGTGKSTLLKTLSKVINPISGEIFFNKKNVQSIPEKQLANQLSLVLTEKLPESLLTVFELVALGRQPYTNWVDTLSDLDKKTVLDALKQTQTLHLQNKSFLELSDGQLQRVLIARALAQNTEVIILDEPTAHLDMHNTIKIFGLLREMVTKQKKTIIISSHQVNLALQLADEIILFTENKIIKDTTKNIIENKFLHNLFSSELVTFNKDLQQFILSKN